MKSQTTLLAILVINAATVTACSSEDPAPAAAPPPAATIPTPQNPTPPPANTPSGNSESKKFFVDKVYPSIRETCGGCHIEGRNGAPRWLGADANSAYKLIKEDYYGGKLFGEVGQNLLILKEFHAGGQKLSGQQKGLVEQWLTLEYGTAPEAPSQSFSESLQNFANCMNFNAWQAAGLDQLANTDASGATCDRCHNDADKVGQLLLSANDALGTFENFRIFPSITKLASSNGFPFQQLIYSERIVDKGTADRNCVVNDALLDLVDSNSPDSFVLNDPAYCHPNYILDQEVEDQLEFFVENTIAIAKNGNCANQGQ